MRNKYIKLLTLLTLILLLAAGCNASGTRESILSSDNNYTILNLNSETPKYKYELYNNSGELIKSETVYRTAPEIYYISGHIICVRKAAGTNLYYEYYFNTLTNDLSPEYESPIALENGMVAYMQQSKESVTLIVCDMFRKESYYNEINLNFAPAANPRDALISVVLLHDDQIEITYLSGTEYEQVQKIITL